MPTLRGHLHLGGRILFKALKKLFFGKPPEPLRKPSQGAPDIPPEIPCGNGFLSREAVFDRNNRLAGHLFLLQGANLQADADKALQREFDEGLLGTLHASPDAWNASPAFVPLNSANLDLPVLDHIRTGNLVLLVQLAADADPTILCPRLEALRARGLALGIFRQPRNPAFSAAIALADFGAVDVRDNEAGAIRDFSVAFRAAESTHPVHLFGGNITTLDEHRLCQQWKFDYFHGQFANTEHPPEEAGADPHKVQLLHLMRLAQGDAETTEIVEALKQDPLLAFRILRYLNSAAVGLDHRIDSLAQALTILGRQRLTRWLAVLLFSVRDPNFGDWLLVESALTRGRLMEELGRQTMPGQPTDPLFLTGIFSCLDRLLRRPLAAILDDMPLSEEVRSALLRREGPFAPLLAIAEASDAFDLEGIERTALAVGLAPESVNRALLSATAWATEVTEHWE